MEGALKEIGWIQSVVVNANTGRIIDGHLRVLAALERGEPEVPVTYVDLDAEEEARALATFDSIGRAAETDESALADLLGAIQVEDDGLMAFLENLAPEPSILGGEEPLPDELENLNPESPLTEAFLQLTFSVDRDQHDIIMRALNQVLDANPTLTSGDALTEICIAQLE
jgi:ParB-like chromosome segregation protein Spo0J